MSEYTPTTEEVKSAALSYSAIMSEADWDAWLAAHDAEVRAGVVAEEPEWEYRWADQDGEHGWPFGFMDQENGESLEEVQSAPANDPEPEYFDNMHMEKRTKAIPAGPWVPVEQGDGE